MWNLMNDNYLFPSASTKIFTEIFPTAADFVSEYKASALNGYITDDNATMLYYLLYARHGNDGIANEDENQFKYRVWSTIMQYAPSWERRLSIQKELRDLTDNELVAGSIAVYNHAVNPSTAPSTLANQILNYINDQNVTLRQRGKLDALSVLDTILKTDVTANFINKFDKLFSKFPANKNVIYWTGEEV